MFRNWSAASKDSSSLGRRHQARQSNGIPRLAPHDSILMGLDEWAADLDLSLHQPGPPSHNRFSTLAAPPLAHHRDREFAVSGPRRRARNSRGSKEAKRRRDARRNKRKFAAQLLDDQLSQLIDHTLIAANMPAPPPAISKQTLTFAPFNFFPRPWQTTEWTHVPSSPPQLPLLNLGNVDFGDFSCPTSTKSTRPLTPLSPPPPMASEVPSWCPLIPSIMSDRHWKGTLPKFTDLSGLPEPKSPMPLQQCQGRKRIFDVQKNKQSRFFPHSSTKPMIKLSTTACRLHASDTVSQDSKTNTWSAREDVLDNPSRTPQSATRNSTTADGRCDAPGHSLGNPNSKIDAEHRPSAANLWHILDAGELNRRRSWTEDSGEGGVPVFSNSSHPMSVPELDGHEIPYVHANSLIGHSNEAADSRAPSYTLHDDLPVYTADLSSPLHLTPACQTHELPGSTQSRSLDRPREASSADQVAHMDNRPRVSDEMARSSEQYDSEQQLFEASAKALPKSRAEPTCDLATFLTMGHVENCWCRDCSEAPELVGKDELTDNEEWMMWSIQDGQSEETPSSASDQTANMIESTDVEEDGMSRLRCASAPEQDDLSLAAAVGVADDNDWFLGYYDEIAAYAQEPASTAEEEGTFLGYFDDGMAFAQESEDDWVWNFYLLHLVRSREGPG